MDVHDIRYLHDESVAEDDELGDSLQITSLFKGRNVIGLSIIGFLIVSIGIVTASLSERTTSLTQSSAKFTKDTAPTQEPTLAQVQIKGMVTCLGGTKSVAKNECDIALETNGGKTYSLQNVQYNDISSGKIVPGKEVTLTGTIPLSGQSSAATSNTSSGGTSGSSPLPETFYVAEGLGSEPAAPSSTPIPTPTITLTPLPTPTLTVTPTTDTDPVS